MTEMNQTAYDMAGMWAGRISSDARSITSVCQNIGFWIYRLHGAPDWETRLEAELDEAEAGLATAQEAVRQARAAIASLRTQTLIAAE